MIDKFENFLGGVGESNFLSDVFSGATNPKGDLADWQHAARLYIDDKFKLAPKQKFLFFINFEISEAALSIHPQLKNRHLPELNMLCKTVDLPQYSANIDVKNQYNRKKVVQSSIDYTPVTLTLHDDNHGLSTYLLEAYYKYYYRDSRVEDTAAAYNPRNTYSSERKSRYGLDNSTVEPFFKSVRLYQLSRKQFTEYTLVNPMIERWGHDTMDYADGAGIAENTMVLNYEAVLYDRGRIDEDDPATFATSHYDKTPSPLPQRGGGSGNLFGEGGVLSGGSSVLGDVASGEVGFGTLMTAANTVKNASSLTKDGLMNEGIGIAAGAAAGLAFGGGGGLSGIASTIGSTAGSVAGIAGSVIPGFGGDSDETEAVSPADGDSAPSVPKDQKLASARGRNTP